MVTGAGRGIGVAIAERLAADGFAVAVNYSRSADGAHEVVGRITDAGGRAAAIAADISDVDQARHLVERTGQVLGEPTVLINNAGMNRSGSVHALSPLDWDAVLAVNLSGAYYCTHFALPAMYAAGWGRVVFVTSPAGGRRIAAGTSAYSAAKAGLLGLARSLAIETSGRGITANAVMPGFVPTDIVASGGDAAVETLTRTWPSISPDSIASTVSFLVSEQGADISGEEIGVWRGGPGRI